MPTYNFIVFGNDNCPYCLKAYALLKSKKLKFHKKNPRDIPRSIRATTIPQIFLLVDNNKITPQYIGGYTDLETFLKNKRNRK